MVIETTLTFLVADKLEKCRRRQTINELKVLSEKKQINISTLEKLSEGVVWTFSSHFI